MSKKATIIWSLIAAVVGAAASFVFENAGDWINTRNASSDLAGSWESTYRKYNTPAERQSSEWVSEDVVITKKFDGFRLQSRNNPDEGDYVADARVHRESVLYGTWESVEDYGHKSGAFILTVAPKGDVIYGWYTSDTQDGSRMFVPWVLARRTQDLEKGKKLLHDQSAIP